MTKVIALTGGIGSGKTTVSDFLKKQHIPVIDTDIIARQVVEPNSVGLKKIVDCFGAGILNNDGSLNRSLLRDKVFNDPQAKTALESILHPLIQFETRQQIQRYKKQLQPLIIVAIPLLIEIIQKTSTRPGYIDEIWVVDCPTETQIERATQRDNSNRTLIKKIISQQASRQQRLAYADRVIENNGTVEQLLVQTQKLINQQTNKSV
ncbi:dephospho-CoA kinase [Thiomicrorhabdus immobilis]|uniref:Dephospho-CoA kinase n=1 Tax=Thiomicrorhabdus immobilis TaxID=2791037 RepID=A0ABN6CXM4_9GAMM|nr:dephospho-CoA kinase [Thiomicrorhabdus immobilis]BCN93841.1 dephospho-CoA kinase [Thiomicrorhabdus immobilis]